MTRAAVTDARILVASAVAEDAQLISKSLAGEFSAVSTSFDAARTVGDFDAAQPDVVVLAFHGIANAQQYYLGLFRLSKTISGKPHRTVLLCAKDEVRDAYNLCRREVFDDYVLFWPVTFDQPRLAMSVRLALRDLARSRASPVRQDLVAMARDIGDVEAIVDRAMSDGQQELRVADDTLGRLADRVGESVDKVSASTTRRLNALHAGGAMIEEVERGFKSLTEEHVVPQIRAAAGAIAPARDSLAAASGAIAPSLAGVRERAEALGSGLRTILIVEDEPTQRQLFRQLLKDSRFKVTFATTGAAALRATASARPDLILMDLMLPDLSGLDVTRRLKGTASLADVPVVMITGRSARKTVEESLEAGAVDFLVKPFSQQALARKISQYLEP